MSGLDLVIIILQGVSLLVLARVILSWIPLFTQRPLNYRNPLVKLLVDVTEPILAPVRRFAMVGMIDLSPIVVIILIQIITQVLVNRQ